MKLRLILAFKYFSFKILKTSVGWWLILKIFPINSPYMYENMIRKQQMFLDLLMYWIC